MTRWEAFKQIKNPLIRLNVICNTDKKHLFSDIDPKCKTIGDVMLGSFIFEKSKLGAIYWWSVVRNYSKIKLIFNDSN